MPLHRWMEIGSQIWRTRRGTLLLRSLLASAGDWSRRVAGFERADGLEGVECDLDLFVVGRVGGEALEGDVGGEEEADAWPGFMEAAEADGFV